MARKGQVTMKNRVDISQDFVNYLKAKEKAEAEAAEKAFNLREKNRRMYEYDQKQKTKKGRKVAKSKRTPRGLKGRP